jgi:hypothetical protein
MKNNNEWEKRRRRYWVNNNFVCKIFMRLYYKLEELIWLGVCVGSFVVIMKFIFFLGF